MAKKSPRLLFTDEERQQPELKKVIKKADKQATKLEKAEANIPKKRVKKKQRVIDEKTGKIKTKLLFEEVDKKKPSSYISTEIKKAPVRASAGAAVSVLRENEDDSSAVSTTHAIQKTTDTGVRSAKFVRRKSTLKPYKTAQNAEKQADKANVKALNKQAKHTA